MNRISLERPVTSSDSEDSEAEEVSRDQEEDPSKVDFHFLKTGNIDKPLVQVQFGLRVFLSNTFSYHPPTPGESR